MSNAVGTEAPNFVDLGILVVNTSDEFNTFGAPAIRVRRLTDGTQWSAPDHVFGEATVFVMSGTRSELDYIYKTGFQNWRENQDFWRQNISMSRPHLDSTPIGKNTTNGKTSPISIDNPRSDYQ